MFSMTTCLQSDSRNVFRKCLHAKHGFTNYDVTITWYIYFFQTVMSMCTYKVTNLQSTKLCVLSVGVGVFGKVFNR